MSGTTTVLVLLGALALAGVLHHLTRSGRRAPQLDEVSRRARWCEDGFLDHMGGVCRHAPTHAQHPHESAASPAAAVTPVERRTPSQALADVDLQLAVTSDLLEVWPADPWALQRRDDLLDERSALTRAAAAPSPRVVRQAART